MKRPKANVEALKISVENKRDKRQASGENDENENEIRTENALDRRGGFNVDGGVERRGLVERRFGTRFDGKPERVDG